jgi:hypothetical protein
LKHGVPWVRLSQEFPRHRRGTKGRRRAIVRKTAAAVGASLFLCLSMAMPALADSSLPEPSGGPNVLGTGGTATGSGGTAFTGSNISSLMVALVVALVIGLASLAILQRRRAAD